ncbi:DEKNAAC102037 [Brettanomyces naardenensis]|uniref:DEKNAAC102037 n=1 Tax=Brettanomyces naardenensis TaxID=13370 RepID=A0A448YJQ3_BRENA|nr:DEKNAAC102037 [Brettanomyces naardenensis]
MSKVFGARVKNVLSGDTLVLSPLNGSSSQERLLSLAHLQAPRLQTNEKYSFESRELLRTLLVGKEIRFWVVYKTQSEREFGDVSSPIFASLVEYILEKGGARLRENGNSDDPDTDKLRAIEAKAQAQKVGLWDPKYEPIEVISRPSENNIKTSLQKPISAIVEKVISGDRLLLRLLLGAKKHCVIPVLIAGVRSPRTANGDEPGEPYGEAAKRYVETRLLAQNVKVSLLGESSSGVLIGKVVHPAGNISDKLLSDGYAEIADWHSTLIGAKGMGVLRKAEKAARVEGRGMWKAKAEATAAAATTVGTSTLASGSTFRATVSRVISADTIELRLKNDSLIVAQLAYLRGPRQSDPETAPFVSIAREFVRQKAIGKQVLVTVESLRPATEQYEERAMVTVLIHETKNLSELIVSNGYATVLHHRKGEDVPEYWDALVESEAQAKKSLKGMFGKAPAAERIVDASENAAKAKPYLFTFENRTKIPGVVEHIMSATRYRISLPREGVRLVLVLGGLANSRKDKDDAIVKRALSFANKKAYQRDVTIDIYGSDRVGGFIGNLYLAGSNEPFQVSLLENGLAQCHERSLNQTKFAQQFTDAEDSAKKDKIGVWKNYDPSQDSAATEEALTKQVKQLKIEKKYYDVDVSEVLKDGRVAVQFLDADRSKLKPFMQKFHSASPSFQALLHAPRRGEVVAAKFSENGKFYRAKVINNDKSTGKFEIQQIDYGTIESVPLSDLRQLPVEFQTSAYKPQAHIVQLLLVKVPPESQPGYLEQAIYFLEDKLLDKQMVACENFASASPDAEMDAELYDPAVISTDPNFSINRELVQKGWGIVKKELNSYERLLKDEQAALLKLEVEAKREHRGCWEYGDIEGDEE